MEEIKSIESDRTIEENAESRSTLVVLSSHNDMIKIHLVSSDKWAQFAQSINSSESFSSKLKIKDNIIDVNQLTKNLDINEIKQTAIKALLDDDSNNIYQYPLIEISQLDKISQDENDENHSEEDYGMYDRRRNQKLTSRQLIFEKKINESYLTSKELSLKLNLSISQINKLKRNPMSRIIDGPNRRFIKPTIKEGKLIRNTIFEFMENSNNAYDAKEVSDYVNNSLNTTYPVYFIRNIMKNELKLSFKRVNPRPNRINIEKLKWTRLLFIVNFCKAITANTLIVNIDEASINRHITKNYSWTIKGKQWEALNTPFTGSTSICMAICSNGSWICLLTNQTFNSNRFLVFFEYLEDWLKCNKYFNYEEILLIMDNCSIHKTEAIKNKINNKDIKLMYLPPYTPQWAPIEDCFALIKNKLRNSKIKNTINLSLKRNYNYIYDWIKWVTSSSVKKMYLKLLTKWRSNR